MSNSGNRDDDDDDNVQQGLSPPAPPVIHDIPDAEPADEDYDVIETDDQGQQLAGTQQRQTADEGRMSEGDEGTQPVIRDGEQGDAHGGRREPKSARNSRRRESRDRRDRELQRFEAENLALTQRLEALEGRMGQQVEPRLLELGEGRLRDQVARLDGAIADSDRAASSARQKIATAMSTADNDLLLTALEERDAALIRSTQLKNEKQKVDGLLAQAGTRGDGGGNDQQRGGQQRQAPQQQPMPTRVQHYANEFSKKHGDWFKPTDLADEDSQIVLALDNAVKNAGFDPSSQDYWDELEDRMRARMPERFEEEPPPAGQQQQRGRSQDRRDGGQPRQAQQSPAQQQRRGPPTAGSSDRGTAPSRKTVTISPQRKEAMIQSGSISSTGAITDKKKYMAQLKSFAAFDAQNAR